MSTVLTESIYQYLFSSLMHHCFSFLGAVLSTVLVDQYLIEQKINPVDY